MRNKIAFSAVMMLAAMGMARAQSLDPIAMRQVGMDLETGSFGFIRSVVAAKGDVRPLEGPAKAIARWQAMIPSLFPVGSDKGGDTRALPEIWSDRAGFDKLAMAASAAATRLAAAAKAGDADAVAVEMKALGEQCGACHRGYRAK
ncbi:MAG: cytochrome c [Rhodopila sp.]|nr:cytochrome c [Rhodopila sp.]